MMPEKSANWEKAKKDLNLLLASNTLFTDALRGEQPIPTEKGMYSQVVRGAPEEIKQKSPLYNLAEYNSSISSADERESFKQDRLATLAAMHSVGPYITELEKKHDSREITDAQYEEERVRNFGDIVKYGPHNREEESLLNAAKTFLTPSEIEEAARSNASPTDVIAECEKNAALRLSVMIMAYDAQELQQEKQLAKDLKEAGLVEEKMPTLQAINEIEGVIAKLEKELYETPVIKEAEEARKKDGGLDKDKDVSMNDVKGPDSTPDARDKSKTTSPQLGS
jgi:hypothetical protein